MNHNARPHKRKSLLPSDGVRIAARCKCGGLKSQHGTDRAGRPHCYCTAMCACTTFREKDQ